MHDLSPTPGSYIHHTLGFKCKPLHVFTVIMAFSKCSFILRCIVYIKTRSEKILFGPFFLWLLVNFKALQDYAEKERYFHPLSAIDSFLSPKCFKKITNKRQTNSRQDRWMWSFCFGCCWALPMYFEWVKCWTKCCFHRNTTCDYVCVCMYACMCANVLMLPWNISGSPLRQNDVHPAASLGRTVFPRGSRGSPWALVQDVFPDMLCSTPITDRGGLH